MAHQLPRLTAAGITVVAVTQAEPKFLAAHLARHPQPLPILSDPGRAGYRTFALGRVGWWHFLRADVWWPMLRLVWGGAKIRRHVESEDVLQLGGDFLLDRDRRIAFAYPSHSAADRPTLDAMLDAVK